MKVSGKKNMPSRLQMELGATLLIPALLCLSLATWTAKSAFNVSFWSNDRLLLPLTLPLYKIAVVLSFSWYIFLILSVVAYVKWAGNLHNRILWFNAALSLFVLIFFSLFVLHSAQQIQNTYGVKFW